MTQFEVYINGLTVDLNPVQGFDLVMSNPMLYYDRVPGSKAAGIQLPKSDRNKLIIGEISDPMILNQERSFFCQQVLNGNLIEEGFATVTNADDGYTLEFSTNLNDFFTGIQNELISQIDFGSFNSPSDWDEIVNNTWDVSGFVAPMVKNTAFYGSTSSPPSGWDGIINKYAGGTYLATDKVPMFFLKRIMDDLAGLAGVTISGSFWTSGFLESLILYNSRVAEGASIETRLHLPDISTGQLFINIRKFLNIVLWFDGVGKSLKMEQASEVWAKSCVLDWSDKCQKPTGFPERINGARLESSLPAADGLDKNSFFDAYLEGNQDNAFNINSVFSSMPMDVGYPNTEGLGITVDQPDQRFGARLLSSSGSATCSNSYNGVVFKWPGNDGLAKSFFTRDLEFWQNTFRVSNLPVALNAADLAKVSRIFKGKDGTPPFVHIHGVNYVIESVKTLSDSSISEVNLLRL